MIWAMGNLKKKKKRVQMYRLHKLGSIFITRSGSFYIFFFLLLLLFRVFFQWIMCIGVWIVALIENLIVGTPQFEPYAMIGGLVWCTGNMTVVPIIVKKKK